ncbi:MAG: OadG family transporter subunit [Verrucomicrobiia bacterium]
MKVLAWPLAFGSELSLGETIEFQILGALVVFSALGFLWAGLEVSGYFFRRAGAKKGGGSVSEGRAGVGVREGTIPAEVVAVVAAAVHVSCRERVQILSIQPWPEAETISELSRQAWTVEGRRQIFDSRRVR